MTHTGYQHAPDFDAPLAAMRLVGSFFIAFGVFLSGFVISEPAPYELMMVGQVALWFLLGLRLSRTVILLLCLLLAFNVGGYLSLTTMADLDEGPIIEQDTVRITHAQSAEDYVSLGRDVEAQVLARAIHAHIHRRVFLNGSRTVVFPPGPGSYASERMG